MIHKNFILFLASAVLFSGSILAFAVSSQYYDGNPLYLQPGETQDVKLMLQNQAGTEDVSVKAEIKDGQNILRLNEPSDIFVIPKGGKIDVHFKVTAPLDAKKGDVFPVTIMLTTITKGTGPIGLVGSIGKGFSVIIGQESDFRKSSGGLNNQTLIYLGAGIALLMIALYFVMKKRKFSKPSKRLRQ